MAQGKNTSYFYAIFGISLVLFVLGIAAVLIVEGNRLSTDFKENLLAEVILKDSADIDINAVQAQIKGKYFVKKITYISKEQAAKILEKDLPENFMDILGYNPLYASFTLQFFAPYINKDSFEMVRKELTAIDAVKQVNFQSNVLESLDKKAQKASLVILAIAAALLAFAVSLIFSTIRLAIFSNRFSIKTQQLFGATRWFIIRPFLGRSIVNGFISGLVACILISVLLGYFDYVLPELGLKSDLVTFAILFAGIVVFGVLISFLSTLMAVQRYLRTRLEDLY